MERVMGLNKVVYHRAHSAERVRVVLGNVPVTVKIKVVDNMTTGRVDVKAEVGRLSGIEVECSLNGRTLIIVANKAAIPAAPRADAFVNHTAFGEHVVTGGGANSKVTLTLTVNRSGLQYFIG